MLLVVFLEETVRPEMSFAVKNGMLGKCPSALEADLLFLESLRGGG
jgi:hypothetical protein